MDNQFLIEKDFKDFSSHLPAIVTLATLTLTVFLVEITHTRFLAAFVVLAPLLAGRLVLHLDYRKWRKEMIATGHITPETFDNLAEKYNVSARQWLTKKELHPMLAISTIVLAISMYFFRHDLELKTYGQETIGTVYRVDANIALPSYAFIEFYVDGQRFTTSTKVQLGDNVSFKNRVYYSSEQVVAKAGQTFRILYSTKDPTVNRLLDDIPIQ